MSRLLHNPKPWLAGLVLALIGMSLLPARLADAVAAHPRHLVQTLIAFPSGVLHSLSVAVRRPPDVKVDLHYGNDPEADYLAQKAYISRLEQELARKEQEIAQLQHLKQQGGLSDAVPVLARVTSVAQWPASHRHLTLNRGTLSGIRPGLAVSDHQRNFVGMVTDAGPATATVRLITSSGTHLAAQIKPPVAGPSPRQVMLLLKAAEDGSHFVGQGDADDELQSGDLAHLADDTLPPEAAGFVIGTVTRVEEDPSDPLRRRVIVRPIRSLNHLRTVIVHIPRIEAEMRE